MKQIFALLSSSSVSSIIGFIVFAIASKKFSTEEIGIYSLFLSLTAISTQFTTGKIELSIPYANRVDEKKIINTAVLSSALVAFFFAIFIAYFIYHKYGNYLSRNYLMLFFLFFLSIFLTSLYSIMNILLTKKNRLTLLGVLITKLSLFRAFGQLFFIIIFKSLISFLFFFSLPLIFILYQSNIKFFFFRKKGIYFKDAIYVYKKFSDKLLYILPASILNALTVYTIPLFFSYHYSLSVVGVYMLAEKLVTVPFRVINTALETKFISFLSKERDDNCQIRNTMHRYFLSYVFIFLLLYFLIQLFVTSPYFNMVFGEGWNNIQSYTKYIVVLYAVFFITSTLSKTITLSSNTRYILFFDILKISSLIVIYSISIYFSLDIFDFLLLYVISMILTSSYLIFKSYKITYRGHAL